MFELIEIQDNKAQSNSACRSIRAPWIIEPSRLINLAEMIPFSARNLHVVLNGLENMERNASIQGIEVIGGRKLPDFYVPDDKRGPYLSFLDLAEQECQRFGLDKIIDRIKRTRAAFGKPIYWSTVKNEFRVIREDILDAIKQNVFLYIESDKTEYYQQGEFNKHALFGEEVANQFPSAAEDIKAAGNCYATGNNTACVFHAMRTAERGLGAIAEKLGVPFERENWQNVIEGIESKIRVIDNWPKGLSKEEAQKFFSAAAMECRHFRNVWRNHVMHARETYDEHIALSVLEHVKAFMQKLAVQLSE